MQIMALKFSYTGNKVLIAIGKFKGLQNTLNRIFIARLISIDSIPKLIHILDIDHILFLKN